MQIGTITKLYRDQKYGNIRINNGEDAHFHKFCLWDVQFDDLAEGEKVEFEVRVDYKGLQAFHIRRHG